MRATARALVAAITICAWILISNHCAIAALTTKAESKQTGCPFHSKPSQPKPKPVVTQCCKILRAVSSSVAKIPAQAIVDLAAVDPEFPELPVFLAPKISFTPIALDTGPPGKTSFVELNRSLRAHAPPFVA